MDPSEKFATLPPPSPDTLAHSERLLALIRREIEAAGGWLDFARYMDLALYAPGLGYYSAGARKFGAAGDFVTAPELSPLFARCLARQCAQVLVETGGDILELGAGSGMMAADLLAELAALDTLPDRYRILDLSAELRHRQRETLAARVPELLDRVEWLDRLPLGLRGVIVGNEVVDALPIVRVEIIERGLRPLGVVWRSGLAPALGPADPSLDDWLAALENRLDWSLPVGYVTEFNPRLGGWVQGLADALERGLLLLIDYGYPRREYYHPERATGTLLCHYRHRVHDEPFLHPGLQDITASVDFSALADAGLDAGLALAGYTTQSWFLFGCGLEQLVARAETSDTRERLLLARQVRRLTLPGEMGDRFQVMGFTRHLDLPLCGFALRDERQRL